MLKNIIILIVVVIAMGLVVWSLSIKQDKNPISGTPVPSPTPSPTAQQSSSPTPMTNYPAGLKVQDIVLGTGAEAVKGKLITVHYTGTLVNGTKFDSSVDRGQPFEFVLGAGQVIKGWDEGFKGMKVGGKRKLTISPELGYGSRGAGSLIPPNATLIFEVQLLAVSDLK